MAILLSARTTIPNKEYYAEKLYKMQAKATKEMKI
jgi:hypothetical protein